MAARWHISVDCDITMTMENGVLRLSLPVNCELAAASDICRRCIQDYDRLVLTKIEALGECYATVVGGKFDGLKSSCTARMKQTQERGATLALAVTMAVGQQLDVHGMVQASDWPRDDAYLFTKLVSNSIQDIRFALLLNGQVNVVAKWNGIMEGPLNVIPTEVSDDAPMSVVVLGAGISTWPDVFARYYRQWSILESMEFDARLGEVETTPCTTMIVGVSIVPSPTAALAHCTWNTSDADSDKFCVGTRVWFSRTHPRRDALQSFGIIEQAVSHVLVL